MMEGVADNTEPDVLMLEADKKYKGGLLNFLTSKANRAEKAIALIKQAANIYILAKDWESAAKAYLKCAQIQEENKQDPAEYYIEAANMQRNYNNTSAVKTMEMAIGALYSNRKWTRAAELKRTLGEIYEADRQYLLASKNYQDAADLYHAEGENNTTVTNILLKAAELKILAGENGAHYKDAIKIYDQVADKHLGNKLTTPGARDLFLRTCILHLANNDPVGASNALEKYSDNDPAFAASQEGKFVADLIKAVHQENVQSFVDECREYNKFIALDQWQVTVLTRIKNNLEENNMDNLPIR